MTGCERDAIDLTGVPGGDNLPPGIGITFDEFDQISELIDLTPVGGFPPAPLLPVDGSEVSLFVGPLVPDTYLALLQPPHVRVATQEPQQFDDDGPQMKLLGR